MLSKEKEMLGRCLVVVVEVAPKRCIDSKSYDSMSSLGDFP